MAVSVAMVDNDIYVPLRFICEKFNYDYKWNYEQNCIEISNKKSGEKIYPYCYDYRKDGKVTTVRNQEDLVHAGHLPVLRHCHLLFYRNTGLNFQQII